MKYPSIRLVYDRKKIASQTKVGLIQIEIKHNKKNKYVSTGVKVYPNQWKNNQICNRFDANDLMDQIESHLKNIRKYFGELDKAGDSFTFDKFDLFLESLNKDSGSFIDFISKRISERSIRHSTKKQHIVMLNALIDFGKIKSFNDVSIQNIKLFDDFIKSKGLVQQSVHGYHKRLKTYINEAMKYELIKKNPYDNFSIPRGESKTRKYLNFEELKKVEMAEISDNAVNRARDCFIFCCYTGLSYVDLERFDWKKNVNNISGKYFIEDHRQKTGSAYKIQILPPAMRILEKYEYNLPVITNQKYNQYLKLVSKYAGIEKPLTSHMARHTFAVFALNNGVRIEVVSKMLAHTDIKTTQIYAKILQKEVEEGFEILENKLK